VADATHTWIEFYRAMGLIERGEEAGEGTS
jgi:hypothetical protein